ncbi:MAG: hypothetical protein V3T23_13400, partial [Nitrososphaerales archaeon]
MSYQLLGDRGKAFEISSRVRQRFPNNGRAVAVWIANAPSDRTVALLGRDIADHLLAHAEVSMALAHRAIGENDFSSAEKLCRKAIEAKPTWSFPHTLLSRIVLKAVVSESMDRHGELIVPHNLEKHKEAETIATRAIMLATQEKAQDALADGLLTRAFAKEVQGDKEGADRDLEEARRILPDNREVKRDSALALMRMGRKDEAIRALRDLCSGEDPENVSYLLALALRERKRLGDIEESIRLLSDLAKKPTRMQPGFREMVITHVLDALTKEQRFAEASPLLDSIPSGSVFDVAHYTFRAILEFRQGKQKETYDFANQALNALSTNTSRDDKRRLALLLSEAGRYKDALPLWQELADPTLYSSDTQNFLECAKRLGQHNLILSACESLRRAGVIRVRLLDLEVSILER